MILWVSVQILHITTFLYFSEAMRCQANRTASVRHTCNSFSSGLQTIKAFSLTYISYTSKYSRFDLKPVCCCSNAACILDDSITDSIKQHFTMETVATQALNTQLLLTPRDTK